MLPIESDLKEFSRLLRLAYIFWDAPEFLPHPFKPRSNYTPATSGNGCLEEFLRDLAGVLPTLVNQSRPSTLNLSAPETRVIRKLRSDKSWVINKSDKGGEVVVSDMEHYILEGTVHLSDDTTYTPIESDPTPALAHRVTQFAEELYKAGYVDCWERNFIIPPNPVRTPVFYHLWKTHKDPLAIRPIVSGCSGPTAGLSAFLDFFLKRKLKEIPAHIGNTDIFLRDLLLLPPLPRDAILVTADVKNLYTTIPQEEGIEALLEGCREFLPLPPHLTRTALNLALRHNAFCFNGQIYSQKTGVAMGSPISPTLAITFMHRLESRFLAVCDPAPLFYRRYIDDVFFIWTHGEPSLVTFLEAYNNMHPSIKFTWKYSDQSVDFLDATIFKQRNFQGLLSFKPYSKPTNRHLYVHQTSHHPTATKKGIIKGEAIRLMRRCSDIKYWHRALVELKLLFRARGYTNQFIGDSLKEVTFISPENRLVGRIPAITGRKFFIMRRGRMRKRRSMRKRS